MLSVVAQHKGIEMQCYVLHHVVQQWHAQNIGITQKTNTALQYEHICTEIRMANRVHAQPWFGLPLSAKHALTENDSAELTFG